MVESLANICQTFKARTSKSILSTNVVALVIRQKAVRVKVRQEGQH